MNNTSAVHRHTPLIELNMFITRLVGKILDASRLALNDAALLIVRTAVTGLSDVSSWSSIADVSVSAVLALTFSAFSRRRYPKRHPEQIGVKDGDG